MTRVKRGYVARRRRNRIRDLMKGSKGAHSKLSRCAQQQAMKKLSNSYRNRNLKKRNFRSLWITRINAAARIYKTSYSQIIYRMRNAKIILNRKILAQLVVLDLPAFYAVVNKATELSLLT
jgi:large subunit ribosomal protein L20